MTGFADSSLTSPRSQGCRTIVMNRAAISLSSKKHTTTDNSTAAAELTELHLCACDVMGFRELMKEIGLEQTEPTIIFQDNQAAIQIAMNRGRYLKRQGQWTSGYSPLGTKLKTCRSSLFTLKPS
jgi:hypothetical protein